MLRVSNSAFVFWVRWLVEIVPNFSLKFSALAPISLQQVVYGCPEIRFNRQYMNGPAKVSCPWPV
jgi:hypothetical protein